MTSPAFLWLPDHQLDVAAILSHADELMSQVSDLLFAYQSQCEGIFELEEHLSFPNTRTIVTHIRPIPKKLPLLVADTLVALRAALEHALFAEIETREGGLDERAAKLVEIPASLTSGAYLEWLNRRARNGPVSLRSGNDLVKRIEGLQPFNRNDPENHPLARLVLHTNHAKHRTLAVTAVRIAAMYEENQRPRSIRDLPPRPEEPLRVGDVIAETPVGTQVPVALFPTVGINRPGTARWPILMTELDEISQWVRRQAVPRLITGTEPPEPALPIHYEISVGHEDHREAMNLGSSTSAAQRHRQRFAAASARIDLADMIYRIDSSLGMKNISAWLKHLPDAAIIERGYRLPQSHLSDPAATARILEILRSMWDEAAEFTMTEAQNNYSTASSSNGSSTPPSTGSGAY